MDERNSGEPQKTPTISRLSTIPPPNPDGRLTVHEAHVARADEEARVPVEARMQLNHDIFEATSGIAEQIKAAVSRLDKRGYSRKKGFLSPLRAVEWKNAEESAEIGWDLDATYRKQGDMIVVHSCGVKLHGTHPELSDAILSFKFEGQQIKTIQFIGNLNVSEAGHIANRLPHLTSEQRQILEMVGSYGLVHGDMDGGIDRLTLSLPTSIADTKKPIELIYEEEQKNDPTGAYYRKDEPYRYLRYVAQWVQSEKGDMKQVEYAGSKKSRLPFSVRKRKENPKEYHQGPVYSKNGLNQSYIDSKSLVPLITSLAAFLPRREVVV